MSTEGRDQPAASEGTTTMSIETAELLQRAAAGDQASWNTLFRDLNPLVRSVVAGYRLDHETAADVCQTVWMRLFEHADRIRQPERLAGWMATTARNEALRCIKRLKRNRPSGVLEDEADLNSPAPDERAIDDETLREVLGAFSKLPDDSQQLMRLLVASPPMPYCDIAERVGRPVGSIGPTRSRCIESLKSHMTTAEPALAA
ncbi:MAG: RNA polymerase sigma factor [Acidimicrobiales bacterium]